MSTDSTGSRRPVNSSHSFTSFSTTVTTLTGSGGALLFAVDLLQSTTIRETAANAATVSSRLNSPAVRHRIGFIYDLMNASRSAVIVSPCVVGTPWGQPLQGFTGRVVGSC